MNRAISKNFQSSHDGAITTEPRGFRLFSWSYYNEKRNQKPNTRMKANRMSHFDAENLHAEAVQCVVCEKSLTGDNWYARIKRDGNTVMLCSEDCADKFYAKRLPLLRYINIVTMFQSPHWPSPARRVLQTSWSRP